MVPTIDATASILLKTRFKLCRRKLNIDFFWFKYKKVIPKKTVASGHFPIGLK
jgi:hypothetical protein